MALPAFTPTGQASLAASKTTANVNIPVTGSPTQVIVANLGAVPAFVALGAAGVTVTVANGTPVLPNSSIVLALGANTALAAITSGPSTPLRITAAT